MDNKLKKEIFNLWLLRTGLKVGDIVYRTHYKHYNIVKKIDTDQCELEIESGKGALQTVEFWTVEKVNDVFMDRELIIRENVEKSGVLLMIEDRLALLPKTRLKELIVLLRKFAR